MNFFSKIAAISSTLKGVLVLVVLVAIGVGGYFTYTRIMAIAQKAKEVGEDTGSFLSGKPTQHGAAVGEACNVGADCKSFVSAFNKEGRCGLLPEQVRRNGKGLGECLVLRA